MRARALVACSLSTLCWLSACRGNFEETPDAGADAPPPPPPVVLRGCELYLAFDEDRLDAAAGKLAQDQCGGDDPATPHGARPYDDELRGKVAFFSGAASLTVADAPRLRGTDAFTLSAWVRPVGAVGDPPAGVIAKRASFGEKAAYTMFLWTGAHMWNDVDSENERIEVPIALQSDRWVHLGLVYDGSATRALRVRAYVDGIRVGTYEESSSRIPEAYDAPLTIGHLPDTTDPDLYFRGMLDDVVMWSRALGDAEVAEWHAFTAQATKQR